MQPGTGKLPQRLRPALHAWREVPGKDEEVKLLASEPKCKASPSNHNRRRMDCNHMPAVKPRPKRDEDARALVAPLLRAPTRVVDQVVDQELSDTEARNRAGWSTLRLRATVAHNADLLASHLFKNLAQPVMAAGQ